MKNAKMSFQAAFALAAAWMASGSLAHAVDYNSDALTCREENTYFGSSAAYIDGGNVYNGASGARTFHCHATKTNRTNNLADLYIRVNDQSSGSNMTCFARSCNYLGTSCQNSSSSTSSGTGRQQLSLGSVSDYENGYFYFVCNNVASGSGILGYEWQQ